MIDPYYLLYALYLMAPELLAILVLTLPISLGAALVIARLIHPDSE